MTALSAAAILLYSLASWRLVRAAERGEDSTDGQQRIALWLGALAVASHLAAHAWGVIGAGTLPLDFFAALSWVTLGMALLSTGVAWTRAFAALGSLVYPLAALTLAGYWARVGPATVTELSWPLQLHALLALLAYATLALAALLAILLAMQDRLLRRRALDHVLLRRLPPLTELESLLFRCLYAGFVLLTLALALGAVFVEDLLAQHLAHKTVLSVLSWAVFGALLLGRWRYGWRGRRAVRLTLTAMALLLLAFFGSKFVLELLLQRSV